MESAANRLQKEAKGYLDSLRGEQFDAIHIYAVTRHLTCIDSHDCFADEDS